MFHDGLCFALALRLSMKSNRMRLTTPGNIGQGRFKPPGLTNIRFCNAVNLKELPDPLPIAKPQPTQIVQDILISTLLRVQSTSSRDVAEAAARYIDVIRAEAA